MGNNSFIASRSCRVSSKRCSYRMGKARLARRVRRRVSAWSSALIMQTARQTGHLVCRCNARTKQSRQRLCPHGVVTASHNKLKQTPHSKSPNVSVPAPTGAATASKYVGVGGRDDSPSLLPLLGLLLPPPLLVLLSCPLGVVLSVLALLLLPWSSPSVVAAAAAATAVASGAG